MIDPYDLTKPWDQRRLQEWFLFGICVAGKGAGQTARKIEALLDDMRIKTRTELFPPFVLVSRSIKSGKLGYFLRKHKLGQYKRSLD